MAVVLDNAMSSPITDKELLARTSVTMDALMHLSRMGVVPREAALWLMAPAEGTAGTHDAGRKLRRLGCSVSTGYRLSDGARVWLIDLER